MGLNFLSGFDELPTRLVSTTFIDVGLERLWWNSEAKGAISEFLLRFESRRREMNTDITASAKPEYPVIDRNPPFTNVVSNFSTLDYLKFTTITGVSVTVGYLSGIEYSSKLPRFG